MRFESTFRAEQELRQEAERLLVEYKDATSKLRSQLEQERRESRRLTEERDAARINFTQATVDLHREQKHTEEVYKLCREEIDRISNNYAAQLVGLTESHERQVATLLTHISPLAKEPGNFAPDGPTLKMSPAEIMAQPAYTKHEMILRERRAREAMQREADEASEKLRQKREDTLTDEEKKGLISDSTDLIAAAEREQKRSSEQFLKMSGAVIEDTDEVSEATQ